MRERIIELRKALGMNQTQFAESIGISRNFINLFEHGNRDLSDRTITDICRVHNANEIWLRSGEGDMFSPMNKEEEMACITRSILKDDDPAYREELIKIIAEMDLDTLKIWYNYAKQWVTNVETHEDKGGN